jgi:hypothetical protein
MDWPFTNNNRFFPIASTPQANLRNASDHDCIHFFQQPHGSFHAAFLFRFILRLFVAPSPYSKYLPSIF